MHRATIKTIYFSFFQIAIFKNILLTFSGVVKCFVSSSPDNARLPVSVMKSSLYRPAILNCSLCPS